MIKKIYIDNLKCLINFHLDLKANQLWLGDNGTGKTSVMEGIFELLFQEYL